MTRSLSELLYETLRLIDSRSPHEESDIVADAAERVLAEIVGAKRVSTKPREDPSLVNHATRITIDSLEVDEPPRDVVDESPDQGPSS